MTPSQTHPDWDSFNSNSYQTIDLTLSSPEPEPEPQRRPQPRPQPRPSQRQAQLYFGREPRLYGMSDTKTEASRPITSLRNPVAPQPARPINPGHIEQIIDTADPGALQRVLLELCQVSPAFSGALVRGLAPHSTSAQGMICQHRLRLQQSKVRVQEDDDDDKFYEATKRKLSKFVHPIPNNSKHLAQSRENGGSRVTRQPHGPSSIPQVKHEPCKRSVSGSDGELHLPGIYPQTAPHLPTLRKPVRKTSGHSSIFKHTPTLMTKLTSESTSINKAPAPTTKTCIVCHEPFVDVNAPCVSHPGHRIRQGDGSITWHCCGEDIDDPGCNFYGQHVTGEEPEEDPLIQRKRPSASPDPGGFTQKRPRAF